MVSGGQLDPGKVGFPVATVTIRPGGINGGLGGGGNRTPPPRGVCNGWTAGAARRNMSFLMGIDPTAFGQSCAIVYTLTVRDLPPSPEDLARRVHSFRKWLHRNGCARDHWVIEFTRAGRPHLHGLAMWDDPAAYPPFLEALLPRKWLELTADLATERAGQHCRRADGLEGWLRYCSKHASRGVAHYQREKGNLPAIWQKTGRVWGASRGWPVHQATFDLSPQAWFRFRRLVKRWLVADAQTTLTRRLRWGDDPTAVAASLAYRRRMLRSKDKAAGQVRGVSQWIPDDVSVRLLRHVAGTSWGQVIQRHD
jgi:hypothetical protein